MQAISIPIIERYIFHKKTFCHMSCPGGFLVIYIVELLNSIHLIAASGSCFIYHNQYSMSLVWKRIYPNGNESMVIRTCLRGQNTNDLGEGVEEIENKIFGDPSPGEKNPGSGSHGKKFISKSSCALPAEIRCSHSMGSR